MTPPSCENAGKAMSFPGVFIIGFSQLSARSARNKQASLGTVLTFSSPPYRVISILSVGLTQYQIVLKRLYFIKFRSYLSHLITAICG